jgi:hypothetical protein
MEIDKEANSFIFPTYSDPKLSQKYLGGAWFDS